MAFNCKLTRNISLVADGDTTVGADCGSAEIAAGGISERIYIYNIDDVENLQFENDMRFDDSLIIDTIITSESFFFIDCTEANYSETVDGKKHTHTLTLTVANTQSITEDTLTDALGNRYLVAFRNKGGDYYRVFGWREGADLTYSMNMDNDTNSYTITLSDESEYPLMTAYADNFKLDNKVFTPIFKPLYDISYCVQSGGKNTGYVIASYVVKINSAGQPLDEDNKLCSFTGKRQVAYRYTGVSSDGGYQIIGTYSETGEFDGLPVRVFDQTLCPIDAQGTITVFPQSVRLNTYTPSTQVAVTTSNAWKLYSSPKLVSVSPQTGNGSQNVSIQSNGIGGDETLVFQNRVTFERVSVDVHIRLIKCRTEYSFDNTVKNFTIDITAEGGSGDFIWSVDKAGLGIMRQGNSLVCEVNSQTSDFQTYTITVRHSDDASEYRYIAINIQGTNTAPVWSLVARYCEDK